MNYNKGSYGIWLNFMEEFNISSFNCMPIPFSQISQQLIMCLHTLVEVNKCTWFVDNDLCNLTRSSGCMYIMIKIWNLISMSLWNITLFNHAGQFHHLAICQLYSGGPSNTMRIFIYYSYIHPELENLSGVILPALCTWIIIYPRNIHRKHCSSQYYFLEVLLINEISLKIPTLFTILLLHKLTLISFYFLPMRIRW